METQRILMRSLAVVFFASVIWTITVSADVHAKVHTCCKTVSTAEVTEPIISVRRQYKNPPCVRAILIETERGEFCCDPSNPQVQKKVIQFLRSLIRKRLTSTPPATSSISDVTHVGGSAQSTDSL